jgi:pimeloyl-ACP methyl ester carboxylesterase
VAARAAGTRPRRTGGALPAAYPGWPDEEVEPWAAAKAQVDLGLFGLSQHWRFRPLPEVLARVTVPTLLLTGEPDRGSVVSPADAVVLRDAAPAGRLLHVPGAGHSIRREQSAAYLVAVRGLLAEVQGG